MNFPEIQLHAKMDTLTTEKQFLYGFQDMTQAQSQSNESPPTLKKLLLWEIQSKPFWTITRKKRRFGSKNHSVQE